MTEWLDFWADVGRDSSWPQRLLLSLVPWALIAVGLVIAIFAPKRVMAILVPALIGVVILLEVSTFYAMMFADIPDSRYHQEFIGLVGTVIGAVLFLGGAWVMRLWGDRIVEWHARRRGDSGLGM